MSPGSINPPDTVHNKFASCKKHSGIPCPACPVIVPAPQSEVRFVVGYAAIADFWALKTPSPTQLSSADRTDPGQASLQILADPTMSHMTSLAEI